MEIEYIECSCNTPHHVVRFSYFKEEKDYIYLQTQLTELPFLERVWLAIKYIFNKDCKYGHWEETILGPIEIIHLKNLIKEFESNDNS